MWLITACSALVIKAHAEPDEKVLGKAEGYQRGTAQTMFAENHKVGSLSSTDKLLPTHEVKRGGDVTPLPKGEEAVITYRLKGKSYTLNDYLDHQRATGLLILKDGRIVAEHYRYGRSDHDRFLSFSMAKSVLSLLIGIAVDKGIIASLDDRADKYVVELKGSEYGQTTIRQLLRMSSGVKFVEDYTSKVSESTRLFASEAGRIPDKPLQVLAGINERAAPVGEKFKYCSSETSVLGYVLARASGKDIATLTSEWLWKPLGAEADAAWNLAADGQEQVDGRFNARLRDYARLGLLLAHDGKLNGEQIVPKNYLMEATDPMRQPKAFQPGQATKYSGYGYQFWHFPLKDRTFAMLGIYGQSIFVQPSTGIVMVQTSVNRNPSDQDAVVERDALWRGVLASLHGHLEPFANSKP